MSLLGKKSIKVILKLIENSISFDGSLCDLPIVIDVANVVYNNGKCLLSRLRAILDFFDGFNCLMPVASAVIRHKIDDGKIFEEMVRNEEIYQAPAGEDDDLFILDIAHQTGALIVSNDKFKEYSKFYHDEIERTAGFIIVTNEDELVVSIPTVEVLRVKMPDILSKKASQNVKASIIS